MSVVIETTLGDVTVDLYLSERPRACLNFLKLCKMKYYNYNLFHTISRGFIGQTGDPTGSRTGGESIFGVIHGSTKRYFEAESEPRIKHTRPGLISFVGSEKNMIGSQFFLTLGEDLTYLDDKHCVFGEVVEGFEILEEINEVICDKDDRPYQDVRITHTIVLNDPYDDPKGFSAPSRSPSPSAKRLAGGRIAPDEEIDENTGKSNQEIMEMQAEREAKARATILEMVGDIPDAEMAPPENVLFVCKLNPVTTDDDLEIIFSRFGTIKSCEVIRDRKSGDSLQYAFIEFAEQKSCEDAYFKMGNVLIDDRRIHVDFSQSVSKVKWLGKGRGVAHFDEKGNKRHKDANNDIGKGHYKNGNNIKEEFNSRRMDRKKSSSPRRRKSMDRFNKKEDRSRRGSRSPSRRQKDNNFGYRRNSRSPRRRRSRSLERPVRNRQSWSSRDGFRRSPRRSVQRPIRRNSRSKSPRYSNRRRSPINRRSSRSPRKFDQRNRSTERPTRKEERLPQKSQKKRDRSGSVDRKDTKRETKKTHKDDKKTKKQKLDSSSEDSSSSEEDKKKKKSKTKKSAKPKKSKKKKKKYSSSSDSSSDSSSESDNKKTKKKKSKKSKTKDSSSDSD